MASSKDLFLKNEEDVKAALGIVKSPLFERMIAFARAEFSQRAPTADQTEGANNFINILFNLPEDEVEIPDWISSGLKHDLSIPKRDGIDKTKTQ